MIGTKIFTSLFLYSDLKSIKKSSKKLDIVNKFFLMCNLNTGNHFLTMTPCISSIIYPLELNV